MWISHFSSVLIQQGWIRSTLSDYRSSFMCEICMLSTPLANNSREQLFGSQDYNDRNDQTLTYLHTINVYFCSWIYKLVRWFCWSELVLVDLSWNRWSLWSAGRSPGSWLKPDVHGWDCSSWHSHPSAGSYACHRGKGRVSKEQAEAHKSSCRPLLRAGTFTSAVFYWLSQ